MGVCDVGKDTKRGLNEEGGWSCILVEPKDWATKLSLLSNGVKSSRKKRTCNESSYEIVLLFIWVF